MKISLFRTAIGIVALTAGLLTTTSANAQPAFSDISDVNALFTRNPTAIGDLPDNFNDLLVYPNPVAANTNVVLPWPAPGKVYVNVINMNGMLARSFQYEPGANELQVDMSRLPNGIYSVRVTGYGIGFHNLKVLKQ
jgi:hypothetical protein